MLRRWIGIGAGALVGLGALAIQVTTLGSWPLQAQTLTPTTGPYAGQQTTSVPGLTEAEIASYREARGMGLARPADINGYPGPLHVLEQADALGLSDDQRAAVQALYDQMRTEASGIGEECLAQYGALELAFRVGTFTPEGLSDRTSEIGRIEGMLRATHLKYHLATRAILTPDQVGAYMRLRGYSNGAAPMEHRPGMDHRQHPGACARSHTVGCALRFRLTVRGLLVGAQHMSPPS